MTVVVDDPDFVLHVGDALDVLAILPDESVHCVVTSPPYFGLRDYSCDGQIGLEPTLEAYVQTMVGVFREVRRVMRTDATLWLNLGDAFGSKQMLGMPWKVAFALQADGWYLRSDIIWSKPNPMPESVTDRPTKAHEYLFLLTRSPRYFYDADAIREPFSGGTHSRGSAVPRDMPKSADPGSGIKNNSSMSAAIWGQAAKPPPQAETLDGSNGEAPRGPDGRRQTHVEGRDGSEQHRNGERWPGTNRNRRSVWQIATESFAEAHFATFPQALVEPCILAGTSEHGCCPECGAPWQRETEASYDAKGRTTNGPRSTERRHETAGFEQRLEKRTETIGWRSTCECGRGFPLEAAAKVVVPCTVLDPFMGSGTTALVARRLGRRTIGIELSPEYATLAATRLQQLSLFADA